MKSRRVIIVRRVLVLVAALCTAFLIACFFGPPAEYRYVDITTGRQKSVVEVIGIPVRTTEPTTVFSSMALACGVISAEPVWKVDSRVPIGPFARFHPSPEFSYHGAGASYATVADLIMAYRWRIDSANECALVREAIRIVEREGSCMVVDSGSGRLEVMSSPDGVSRYRAERVVVAEVSGLQLRLVSSSVERDGMRRILLVELALSWTQSDSNWVLDSMEPIVITYVGDGGETIGTSGDRVGTNTVHMVLPAEFRDRQKASHAMEFELEVPIRAVAVKMRFGEMELVLPLDK